MVEPHVLVHAEFWTEVASGLNAEVRAGHSAGSNDAVSAPHVLAIAYYSRGRSARGRLSHLGLVRGRIDGDVGAVCANGLRAAYHLVCQLGEPYMGLSQLRHERRQPQQLVGWSVGVRRGLAQQPPRLSATGPTGS